MFESIDSRNKFRFPDPEGLFSDRHKKRMSSFFSKLKSESESNMVEPNSRKFKNQYLNILGKYVVNQIETKFKSSKESYLIKQSINRKIDCISNWLKHSFPPNSTGDNQEIFNIDFENNSLNKGISPNRSIFISKDNNVDFKATKMVQGAILKKIINSKFLKQQSEEIKYKINSEDGISKHLAPIYLSTNINGLFLRISSEPPIKDYDTDLREERKISYSLSLLPDREIFDGDENIVFDRSKK